MTPNEVFDLHSQLNCAYKLPTGTYRVVKHQINEEFIQINPMWLNEFWAHQYTISIWFEFKIYITNTTHVKVFSRNFFQYFDRSISHPFIELASCHPLRLWNSPFENRFHSSEKPAQWRELTLKFVNMTESMAAFLIT